MFFLLLALVVEAEHAGPSACAAAAVVPVPGG